MNSAYHSDFSAISNTMLRTARHDGLPVYYSRYVVETEMPPPPTAAQLVGLAAHCRLLEPEKFSEQFFVAAKLDMRCKGSKEAMAEVMAAAGDRTVISPEDAAVADVIAAAVNGNPVAGPLLAEPGQVEEPMYWWDLETGLRCKCRPDKLLDHGCLVEFKTTESLPTRDNIEKAVRLFEYGAQVSHYTAGAGVTEAVLIFAQKVRPFAVSCWQVGEAVLARGAATNRKTLRTILNATTTGQWAIPESLTMNTIEQVR